VPHQFVGETAADAGDEEVPDGVFQDGAVARFLDVVEVGGITTRSWSRERHVADSPGGLAQYLGWHRAVTPPLDAVVTQESLQLAFIENRSTENVNTHHEPSH
jgi:hypothetical protein